MKAVTVKTKAKCLNGNNVRMTDLPEFARENWRDTFLPTLYDKFFASDQPFDGFCKGSEKFTALLQCIVEEVYPDIDYEVTSSDSIHFLVRFYLLIFIFVISIILDVFLSRLIIGLMKSDPG